MNDVLLHALLASDQVRVCAVSGKELVERARVLHGLSRTATAALGRQLMMTAMLGSQLKNAQDRVSTIIKGGGCGGTLLCTAGPDAAVKGYAQNPASELPPTPAGKLDVGGYVGTNGSLTVVRDAGFGDPYVGVCNLVSGEIAMDFAQYFTVSEQQPSLIYLGVRVDTETGVVRAAGGLLLQPLPGCDEAVIDRMSDKADAISGLSKRLETGENLESAIRSILSEEDLRVVRTLMPAYHCDCSRGRIDRALISVGEKELTEMIEQDGGAEVACQFCDQVYRYTKEELLALLQQATGNPEEHGEKD